MFLTNIFVKRVTRAPCTDCFKKDTFLLCIYIYIYIYIYIWLFYVVVLIWPWVSPLQRCDSLINHMSKLLNLKIFRSRIVISFSIYLFFFAFQVDSFYCPNCLENMPSAEAKLKKNRLVDI